ncbi:MAG: fibronectin type III domain-containing protein [Spirochaetes bacterium]|nr:fibronectin type III domain-containing protein [Spirochaetota bacterium]MBN2772194.1 fibronectin type III domain-containing protein [Spirochaetota bacterium]
MIKSGFFHIVAILLVLQPALSQNEIVELQVSHGKSYFGIPLRWTAYEGTDRYDIYRSEYKKGKYDRIATVTKKTNYTDTNCEPGVEYYYRVLPVINGKKSPFSRVKSGYRLIDVSDRFSLNSVLDKKNKKISFISTDDKQRLDLLKSEYIGWLRIRFILLISRPYFYSNKVIVLSDFDQFTASESQNTINFLPADDDYRLTFYARRPFALLQRTGDQQLFDRLIRNSIAFCVYQGDVKIRDSKGRSKYVPQYEAIGLATHYYKYSEDWAWRTILFSSEREEIMQQMHQIEEGSKN